MQSRVEVPGAGVERTTASGTQPRLMDGRLPHPLKNDDLGAAGRL